VKNQAVILFLLLALPSVMCAQTATDDFQAKADTAKVKHTNRTEEKIVDSLRINYFTTQVFELPAKEAIDYNSLDRYHVYSDPLAISMSTYGQAAYALIWKPVQGSGFKFGRLDNLIRDPVDFAYYDVNVPYTAAKAIIGSKLEQHMYILHTQNIKRNWNISVDMQRLDNGGFFTTGTSEYNLVNFGTNYRSKNSKYTLFANFAVSKHLNLENGGIADIATFESQRVTEMALNVNMVDANTSRKNSRANLEQHFYLGKSTMLYPDSLGKGVFKPSHRIVVQSRMDNTTYRFRDNFSYLSGYDTTYFDSTVTNDVNELLSYSNSFRFERVRSSDSTSSNVYYSIGGKHGLYKMSLYDLDTTVSNMEVTGIFRYRGGTKLTAELASDYVIDGYNAGDYHQNVSLRYQSTSALDEIEVYGSLYQNEPSWTEQQYTSNAFRWDNDFSKTVVQSAGLKLGSKCWNMCLSVDYSTIKNAVYFNSNAEPEQATEAVGILQGKLKKDLKWRKWHFDNTIQVQGLGGADVIRLPAIVTQTSLYLESKAFKGALETQIGVDLLYFSDYLGAAYMPATGSFYQQNYQMTGNYPFADFFFNARIDKVRFFAKLTHLNAGFFGYAFYAAPNYPFPPRALKFGLEWKFLN
jgi:hypothetical protein